MPTTPAQRAHYLRNRERYIAQARAAKDLARGKMREIKAAPCMDCGGIFPPECMDFDHRDGSEKSGDVSKYAVSGSMGQMLREVAKCDLVCANCHRIRTVKRRLIAAAPSDTRAA